MFKLEGRMPELRLGQENGEKAGWGWAAGGLNEERDSDGGAPVI